ncbi:hypothetical protein [Streptomyces xylophagus]|uniref:hypothetical protein n=1 Tax=Streptomyces xylophagus TaxID=285514 RepID=UPI0005BB0808|nr:hypothetical protein [Streptomyces xylophagus]
MRKRIRQIVVFATPVLLAGSALIGLSGTANAAIISDCSTTGSVCYVYEGMGVGYCEGKIYQSDANLDVDPAGNFAYASYINGNSGYTCDFWTERNVNNTGWYRATSIVPLASGVVSNNGNVWNGSGYQAEVCFQFNWGSSLGAVHCSPPVSIQ